MGHGAGILDPSGQARPPSQLIGSLMPGTGQKWPAGHFVSFSLLPGHHEPESHDKGCAFPPLQKNPGGQGNVSLQLVLISNGQTNAQMLDLSVTTNFPGGAVMLCLLCIAQMNGAANGEEQIHVSDSWWTTQPISRTSENFVWGSSSTSHTAFVDMGGAPSAQDKQFQRIEKHWKSKQLKLKL